MAEIPTPALFIDNAHPQTVQKTADLIRAYGETPAGVTTNPSHAANSIKFGHETFVRIPERDALARYRSDVEAIDEIVPDGPISIQVRANPTTTPEEMIEQAQEQSEWLKGRAVNKLPATIPGFMARATLMEQGYATNMTLIFDPKQIWVANKQTELLRKEGKLPKTPRNPQHSFVSPFYFRSVDEGYDGVGLVESGMDMRKAFDKSLADGEHTVYMLHASVRTAEHMQVGVELGADAITAPLVAYEDYLPLTTEERKERGRQAFENSKNLISVNSDIPEDIAAIASSDELLDALVLGKITFDSPLINKYLLQFVRDWESVAIRPEPKRVYNAPRI